MASLLESISSNVKTIFDLAKLINDSKLLAEIGGLQMQLSELKTAYAALEDENMELKAQRQEDSDNPLSISPSGIYFDTQRNPFCTGCYDGPTRRRVHLAYTGANVKCVFYICPVCKTEYQDTKDVGIVIRCPPSYGN